MAANRYERPSTDRRGDADAVGDDDDDDDDNNDDRTNRDSRYTLDVMGSLRTVAGLEMPAGSRAWMDSGGGALCVHSTPWDHGRLARWLDASAFPEGTYLLDLQEAGAPQPGGRLDTVAVRGEPFSVPLPAATDPGAAGPLQLHGQITFGRDPLQGLLSYRIERPAVRDKPAAGLAQGSLALAVGVPAEISLPGPEARPLGLRLSGLRRDGTRRPWPVLADTLAEQQAAQATPCVRALRECRLPALAVNGLAAEAALRRLREAWEATPGAPPCNLAAVLDYGVGGPLSGDWPAQSLAEALARFCVDRKLPLGVAGDVVFIGYGPVPSDRGWLLLSCPAARLPLLPSGKPAPDEPATIAQLRRLIYREPIDFGPCDKAWYIPGLDCIYARGRLDFRLRLAEIVERCLLPAPSGTQGE